MNRQLHRIVFNAARGMRMVVQETAKSTGKGSNKATTVAVGGVLAGVAAFAPMLIGATLAGILTGTSAHAQIVGAPNVPGNLRPTVLVAPNGVPYVNIQTPSAAGVSRNVYNQFNIGTNGAILNNSRVNVQSQLGGYIQGNPFLATGPARIIVNEVNGGNPSQIRGYLEVAGQRAEIIIANPAGISINGGGFINASRATVTTGTPQFNAIGGLDSFLVRGGTVTIDGAGLDARTTDYAAILARAVQLNAAIYATDLKVVTGASQISADHTQITPTTGTGAAPTFALDSSALGGMYANKITMIGTEAGLGVRNAGSIGASTGNLVVTASGQLINTGTLEGQSVQLASTGGDIDNRGGTIRQTSSVALAIAAPTLSNTSGGVIGLESAPAPAPAPTAGTGGTGTGGTSGTGTGSTSSGGTPSTTGGTTTTSASAPAPAPIAPGSITATGTIRNDGGKIYAGGPITLQSANINNNGGTLSVASMAVSQPTFDNHGGTLNVSNGFSANVERFDNTGGTLNAGSLNIATTGDLINVDGKLTSAADATLTVGGSADNTRGTISATSALTANVAGAVNNTSGTLVANQGVALGAGSLDNTQGSIQSAQAGVQLAVANQLSNGSGGTIGAATDLKVQAGSLVNANGASLRGANDVSVAVGGALANDGSITAGRHTTVAAGSLQSGTTGVLGAGIQSDGKLGAAGDVVVTTTGALVANGTNLAAGNATLQGASVDLSASQTSAVNIAVTATQGNVVTGSQAKIVTPGTLRITTNAQPGQTLVNDAGALNAGQLDLHVSNLANTNGGEIVQTGTGATTIATTGTLNNNGGRIASNGQDLSLSGANITNAGGKIEHAGTGTLTIAGGNYSGTDGQITANGALTVAMSGAFNQDGAKAAISAKQLTIDAGSLSNRGGQIVQTGADATRITVVGALDNSGGTLASNGNTTVAAGSLANQGGILRAAETSDLGLTVGDLLDNSSKGVIGAGGSTTIAAGSLNNNSGRVTAVGDLNATVGGAASNVGGTLAANGHTTLVTGTLDNSSGTAAAVNGNLRVTTTGATTNNGGTLQAGAATTLLNGGLSNVGGKVFGNSLSVNTRANGQNNALNNTQGTLAATTTATVSSGAFANDAGLIQSGGVMTINTNGQDLSNTNAAGYASGQGGITSGDTLNLITGAVNNNAGFIGAKNALVADTQAFSNTGGGQVLGQSTVAINTNGASYDNTGGQTLALGDLGVNAGSITNTSGLIRSAATTTLNAGSIANTNTLGTNQGIEGQNVAIGTGHVDNTSGAIRADVDATITSGGTVNNTNGLISAGNELGILDPNRANPGAKTLNLVNTGGSLVADKSLKIDAATFSGDGRAVSGKDLSIALTQNIVNNGEVAANGNLSYTTTGNFTNNGKLLAGQTLTVDGNNVDNTANAEMSGTDTVVNAAGTLTNRGLIDSQGATQINAGTLKNIGTGRIYGDDISIGAGTLENDAETVNGVTKAATIAARDTLDIGAGTINNREHALLFSAGDMFIGGGLGSDRQAIGKGSVLNNESATIESLGDMSIAMGSINNVDTHLKVATTSNTQMIPSIITMDGKSWDPYDAQGNLITWGDPSTRLVYHKAADGTVSIIGKGWTNAVTNITVTEDSVVPGTADPARIVAGGNMRLDGHVYNRDSQIMAGGALDASDVDNQATPGKRDTTVSAIWIGYNPNRPGEAPEAPIYILPTTTTATYKLTDYQPQEHLNATRGYNAGVAPVGGATGSAGGTGGVNGGNRPGAIVEVPANVGGVVRTSANGADAAGGAGGAAGTGASPAVPMVVRTSLPNTSVPNASLFNIHAGPGRYLIETDPRFTNYRAWLSSDYMLSALGLDPSNTLKRLGDGFYEQRLIREQVAQLTGYRYLDGHYDDQEQYKDLMTAGATFAQQYGLRPGVALTAAQMAQLTSDIVWLVEQTVTLPDGSVQQVLVPQVYVRVRAGDINGNGAILSADTLRIKSDHDLTNTGTLTGRSVVAITAENVNNLGGRISGGNVGITARQDLNNIGGSIDARDSLNIDAGRDINVRSTTQTNGFNTNVDRVAGLYVTNPGGTLVASAGRDVNLIGGIISNQGAGGYTSISAKNDINLGTVTERRGSIGIGASTSLATATSTELGSTIATNGTTLLSAGRDFNARQATVDAGEGLLTVRANRDINIASGQTTVAGSYAAQWTDSGTFSRTDNKFSGSFDSSTSVGSSFSGGTVLMGAGRDITIEGSKISGTQGVAISAARNLTVVEGRNTSNASAEFEKDKRGIGGMAGLLTGNPIIPVLPYGKNSSMGAEIHSDTASASKISSSQGGVLLQGGNSVFLQGVQVDAAKDITIKGGNVIIQAATNSSSVTGSTGFRTKGIEPGQFLWHDPSTGINARKTTETKVEDSTLMRTTLNGANVSIEAADTLAMAATTVNTPGTLSLSADNLILGTQTTEHSTQTTSQGRDLAYQKVKDKGQSDQTTNYNQFNVGNLAVNANRVQAGLGARDSVEALAKQPGMGWVEQITNDPKLSGKIDWKRVEEEHKTWNYDQQGLTPEGAAIVTIVVAYFTAGAASEIGAAAGGAAGDAAAMAVGQGVVIEGSVFAAGSTVGAGVGTFVSGAVAAGLTTLATQASIALINNQGDIGGALHDLGSSANVRNLLTAVITGGVLSGLSMDPTGLPTTGGGSQGFLTQLGQNLQAGAARAVIGTAINGGSFEENLKEGLKSAILDTIAAQGANAIGTNFEGLSNKVAHAIAGCMVGAARADSASGCGAGALGAAIGEIAAEAYGRQADTVQFAAMMSALAVAITGGDAAQINLGSQAGSNAAANNYLNHDQWKKLASRLKECNEKPAGCSSGDQSAIRKEFQLLSTLQDDVMRVACADLGSAACRSVLNDAAEGTKTQMALATAGLIPPNYVVVGGGDFNANALLLQRSVDAYDILAACKANPTDCDARRLDGTVRLALTAAGTLAAGAFAFELGALGAALIAEPGGMYCARDPQRCLNAVSAIAELVTGTPGGGYAPLIPPRGAQTVANAADEAAAARNYAVNSGASNGTVVMRDANGNVVPIGSVIPSGSSTPVVPRPGVNPDTLLPNQGTLVLTESQARNLEGANRGLIYVTESPRGKQAAQDFQNGTSGAFSDLSLQKPAVPALRYDNPNNGLSFIKFDGIETGANGNSILLIDAKTKLAIWSSSTQTSVMSTLERVRAAVTQNPGYSVVYEFPNPTVAAQARQFINQQGYSDVVSVRVRQP
ncbi:filamentous hemagglutinin N-terminal domain-containing protein [Variovorax sp. DXTD-1]|uniref:two-partner secretion domain-containing protein n=1 Tax=Variovorax sp. DXTD-1 TaxID=2495592 RepID=UPI000F85CD10|nr:filamentous hemagglutinin N-terminal domain-containing protein [Variovorax sp. DXTD-1]RST54048.1 filamentous hemagglutinin N-terminal domain-containing protein [Variovorax sp. DXTD-1]